MRLLHHRFAPPAFRVAELDGMRGLAVAMVVGFAILSVVSPLARALPDMRILGVQLVFLVTGFVITLSLPTAGSALRFASLRIVRIWPTLAFCAGFSFLALHLIDTAFTAELRAGWSAFAPSLSLTDPVLWHARYPDAAWIDPSYWALWAEARFFFWATVIYGIGGRRNFARNFVLFTGLAYAAVAALSLIGAPTEMMAAAIMPQHMYLFCAGIVFCDMWLLGGRGWHLAAVGVISAMMAIFAGSLGNALVLSCFFGLFAVLQFKRSLLWPLTTQPMVWLGKISVPLYLLHLSLGGALLSVIPDGLSFWITLSMQGTVLAVVVLLAAMIHSLVEQPARAWVRRISPVLRRRATVRPLGIELG